MHHHWHWHEVSGYSFLRCDLLSPWWHGFFTRSSWPAKPEDLASIVPSSNLPGSSLATFRTKQVHGNRVLWTADLIPVENGTIPELQEADGLMAEAQPPAALWVATADCTPILLGDLKTGRIAALHAGWRGTAAQIAIVALQAWQDRGSQLQDVRVVMGPAITGTVYQVEQGVALQVCQTIAPELSSENLLRLMKTDPSPLLPDPEPGKVRLDVRQVNALQLVQYGLHLDQISIAPYCTFQNGDRFFSYRRTGEKQVQWSGICNVN